MVKKLFIASVSLLNAFFMVWLTFFLLSLPQSLPDEYFLVQSSGVLKRMILQWEDKLDTSRYLFVNVCWDKALIPRFDPQIPEYPIGNEPITDRQKLVELLALLKQSPTYQALLFDINFKGKTEHDSLLASHINSMPRMTVSYHRDDTDKPDYPDIPIKNKCGLSDIEKVWDLSFKYKIYYNDSLKTTALNLFEELYPNKKYKKASNFFYLGKINNDWVLNSFILDYRLRAFHYNNNKCPKLILGEWLTLAKDTTGKATEDFKKLVKNRIIVVGDFEDRDIHETIYGKIPGPLILVNALLALEAGDNLINFQFLFYLALMYFIISYISFSNTFSLRQLARIYVFRQKPERESFLESLPTYMLYFSTISVISYFIFSIHIGVLVLAFYMFLLEKSMSFGRWALTKRRPQ